MILGQISYLDCLVFLIVLAPQLLLHVNIIELVLCVSKALPFVCKSWPSSLHRSDLRVGSLPITVPILSGEILYHQTSKIPFRSTSLLFPGPGHKDRPIRVRFHPCKYRPRLLFQRSCSTLSSLSSAASWLHPSPLNLARGRPCRSPLSITAASSYVPLVNLP